jgi:hypothetical protein
MTKDINKSKSHKDRMTDIKKKPSNCQMASIENSCCAIFAMQQACMQHASANVFCTQ